MTFRRAGLSALFLITIALPLSACGDQQQRGPGGLTPDDAKALDEAAEKLDADALPAPVIVPQQAPAENDLPQNPADTQENIQAE